MIFLWLQFISLIVFRFFLKGLKIKRQNEEKIFAVFAFLNLSIVMGLRGYDVGTDTIRYATWFVNRTYNYEFSYNLVTDFVRFLTSNASVYLLVISILTHALVIFGFYRNSISPSLCILYYVVFGYYYFMFNGMRQGVALGLSLLALYYAKKKKLIPYLVYSLFSISFHLSGVVTISFLFFFTRFFDSRFWPKLRSETKIGYILNCYILPPVLLCFIIVALSYLFTFALPAVVNLVLPRYAYYFNSIFYGLNGGVANILISVCILGAYYYLSDDNSRDFKINCTILIVGTIIATMSTKFNLLYRVGLYFYFIWPVIISSLLVKNKLSGILKVLFRYAVGVMGFVYFAYIWFSRFVNGVENYHFFWD